MSKPGVERNRHQQAGNGTDQGEHPGQRCIAIGAGRQDNKTGEDRNPDGKREKRRA
jgi:hypothetical protein